MEETKTILVVEDDEDIRSIVKSILEEGAQYLVKTAANGLEALALIRKEGLTDLILLDITMPEMDGWQFASEFHKLYDRAVPIVVMTAAGDSARRAADIGAEGCLGKPFDLDELLSTLQRHLA